MSIWDEGVSVETVDRLRRRHEALDIPSYYEAGEENPYAGLARLLPRNASYYVMVPQSDQAKVAVARKVMKGLAGRRKVGETVCEKDDVNYSMFAKPGRIVLLWT